MRKPSTGVVIGFMPSTLPDLNTLSSIIAFDILLHL